MTLVSTYVIPSSDLMSIGILEYQDQISSERLR